MSTKYNTTIIGNKQVTPDVTEILISRPPDFDFRAGQYIQLGLPELRYPDPQGASRVFSLASSPFNSKVLSVAFRDTGSGFKESLKSLALGTDIIIEGPTGFFTLPEQARGPIVLIAGGIGVTPYLSMLLSPSVITSPITLLYSHDELRAPYIKELQQVARQNNSFELLDISGRIDGQLLEDNVSCLSGNSWYLSGPPAMVEFVRNELYLLGVDSDSVIYEEFTGYDSLDD